MERKGRKPFAVVVSPEQYQQLQKQQERAFALIDKVQERNADKSEEEVYEDVTAEVEAVRQELYERHQRDTRGGR